MKRQFIKHYALVLLLFAITSGFAQGRTSNFSTPDDPRGEPEVILCSQNLENYGLYKVTRSRVPGLTEEAFEEKENALVERFANQGCSLIAVQEVIGDTTKVAEEGLRRLAALLRRKTGRFYEIIVGSIKDTNPRVGFLYAKDSLEVLAAMSFSDVELPKLAAKQKPRFFTRGPLEVQFRTTYKDGRENRLITVINIHYKSKRGGEEDPTGLDWETHRMEMAEATRRLIEERHKDAFAMGKRILAVVGDRNSNFDVASAKILEGVVTLSHFAEGGVCRMTKRGVPLCEGGSDRPQLLFSVLTQDPDTKLRAGTYSYKKVYSWLDDILMPASALRYALASYDRTGDYASGVVYTPADASDHAMVYVNLNW